MCTNCNFLKHDRYITFNEWTCLRTNGKLKQMVNLKRITLVIYTILNYDTWKSTGMGESWTVWKYSFLLKIYFLLSLILGIIIQELKWSIGSS